MLFPHFRAEFRDCLDDVVGALCIKGFMGSFEASVKADAQRLVLTGEGAGRQFDLLPGRAEFLAHLVDDFPRDAEIADTLACRLKLTLSGSVRRRWALLRRRLRRQSVVASI
jgi:hypothetical protein